MNERLRNALVAAHITRETLANITDVDPKTVERWLQGRVPHARHRWKIAELLKEHEEFFWPSNNDYTRIAGVYTSEIVAAYAHRTDLPSSAWRQFFEQAKEEIDLLGYAILFIPEQNAGIIHLFQEKAKNGCKIRIALADPTCEPVRLRDEEEQLGGTLPGRIKSCLYHFRDIRSTPGIEIRYHSTILYNSLFRVDHEMLVTPHLYGLHGSKAPLFSLRHLGSDGVFANFTSHFERIWETTHVIGEK